MDSMINFHKVLPISALAFFSALASSPNVTAQTIGDMNEDEQVNIIQPKKIPKEVKTARIDTEKYELGIHVGVISLSDFGTVSLIGISGSYHISSRWAAGVSYGQSGEPEASFEQALGRNFIPAREDGFKYLAVTGHYQIFHGRSFFAKGAKFNTHISLEFGLEDVDFLAQNEIGAVLGVNYKVVLTDWLTGNLMFKDHIVERSFLGEDKMTQNLEMSFGLNVMF
ncbi:MAG: outer membrane beta-barrel domain-containing protein [Alteromonadaceae bacterium]|nr:MAG: outer membrane beta-barrel domain-containing protein [Alteromonadaceae bacterium]